MPLIDCPECHQQISDRAKFCPKCKISMSVVQPENDEQFILDPAKLSYTKEESQLPTLYSNQIYDYLKNFLNDKNRLKIIFASVACTLFLVFYYYMTQGREQTANNIRNRFNGNSDGYGHDNRSNGSSISNENQDAINIVKKNQHVFSMDSQGTSIVSWFEARQKDNAQYDPTITITGFEWSANALSDNPNKIKVEYNSYPTQKTCRYYWLVDFTERKIHLTDSNSGDSVLQPYYFDQDGIIIPSESNNPTASSSPSVSAPENALASAEVGENSFEDPHSNQALERESFAKYTLQIASRKNISDAQNFSLQIEGSSVLKKDVNGETWFAVVIGRFQTKEDALEYKTKLLERYAHIGNSRDLAEAFVLALESNHETTNMSNQNAKG